MTRPIDKHIRLAAVTLVSMIAFSAVDAVLAQDDNPFSRYELYLYVSDKTQLRDQGSFFYSGSGRLQVSRDGKCESGKWSTTDDGAMCWHVTAWGELPCESYFHAGDEVRIVRDGRELPTPQLEEGNTLNCPALRSGSTVITGVKPDEDYGDGLFTRQQTIEFLSGKTVVWGPGRGLYYAPDYRLEKIWDGVRASGSWRVNEAGAVCWSIPGWGPTPCESYYYRGDELMAVFDGRRSGGGQHLAGNKLDKF